MKWPLSGHSPFLRAPKTVEANLTPALLIASPTACAGVPSGRAHCIACRARVQHIRHSLLRAQRRGFPIAPLIRRVPIFFIPPGTPSSPAPERERGRVCVSWWLGLVSVGGSDVGHVCYTPNGVAHEWRPNLSLVPIIAPQRHLNGDLVPHLHCEPPLPRSAPPTPHLHTFTSPLSASLHQPTSHRCSVPPPTDDPILCAGPPTFDTTPPIPNGHRVACAAMSLIVFCGRVGIPLVSGF